MTMRYRQAYPRTSDALDVKDWNRNMDEIASEFNGYLDRDNVAKNVIDLSMVKLKALNRVHSDAYERIAGTKVALQVNTTEWQADDGTDAIGRVQFYAPYDCQLICDFSGEVEVTANLDPGGVGNDFVRFRIVADGSVVAVNGFSALRDTMVHSLYLTGSIPVLAGWHTVEVQAHLGTVYLVADPTDVLQMAGRLRASIFVEVWARELVVIERRR